ncbi:hypothetical protein JVU11DRAFT_7590 [Chiua virens]|nr:hypothetical protein JVU11DRAFT_7590 [Chiua virens]
MTTPLVLAPLPPPSDTALDNADCELTRNVVRVALTALAPSMQTTTLQTATDLSSTHNASDGDVDAECKPERSPWTGTPLRAIVPLPRRKRASATANSDSPCLTRAHWDDAVETDSEDEHARDTVKDGDADDADTSGPRYCSYESITAAEGLSFYSFDELRVECYAQSLIARGTRPPSVVQPSLAIPPAFVPRIISRY